MQDSEKIEYAEKLKDELQSLRENKKEKFKNDTSNKEISKNSLLRGVVEYITPENNKAKITVQLYHNEKEIDLYLNKPNSEEEYTDENELIRAIRTYGDIKGYDKDDISKLIYRDIFIKKIDDEYEIHLPKNLRKKSKLKFNIRNKLIKHNIIDITTTWEEIRKNDNYKLSFNLAHMITGFVGLYIFNIVSEPISAISSLAIGFTGFLIALLIGFIIEEAVFGLGPDKSYVAPIFNFFVPISFIIIYLSAFGFINHPSIDPQNIIAINPYEIGQLFSVPIILFLNMIIFKDTTKLLSKKLNKAKNYIENMYKSKRGVEFR